MIKVVLAEDNSFLAQALLNKIGLFDDIKIKFHALDGEELLNKLESDPVVDVILMDIQMPVMDGITATKHISEKYPHIKIIMLTILDSEQSIYDSIQSGANGYLIKESSPQELYDGISDVINGGAPLSSSIAIKAFDIIKNPDMVNKEIPNFRLSGRETEVLTHLCKGLNYNQIAINLFISPNTVRRHIENIYHKMDVHNKAEALQIAYKYKLV